MLPLLVLSNFTSDSDYREWFNQLIGSQFSFSEENAKMPLYIKNDIVESISGYAAS